MKNLLIIASIFIIAFVSISNLYSQDLSIQETLDYINEKINSNKPLVGEKNARYFWEISENGKLKITKYWNEEFESSQIVFIKSLDSKKVQVICDYTSIYSYRIHILCKKNEKLVTKKWNYSIVKSPLVYVRFAPDKEVARRIRNAIAYLIELAEKEEGYKTKEKDPFDY